MIALLALATVGCRQGHSEYEQLTDSEKLEVLDLRIERNAKDAEAHAERAAVLFNLGRANEAIADMNKAVELEPERVVYRLRQADYYFAGGDVEKSYKALSEAERLSPTSVEVQLKMGEVMFYSRDYDRALRCLTNVTEREPDNETALLMTGFVYKEMGDTVSAVKYLRRMCDLYPDEAAAFEELGVLYGEAGNPLALEYLGTALQLEPNNTNVLYALGMYHQDRGEMEEAESYYRQLLTLNPQSADAWHNLGFIELTWYQDYGRAMGYFDSALSADPGHAAAKANRALAEEMMNQF